MIRSAATALALFVALAATAQTPPSPPPPPDPVPAPQPQTPPAEPPADEQAPPAEAEALPPPAVEEPPVPSILSRAAASSYERRDTFPNVNLYLPEGQASVRLRKLIRNVLFESQIDYRFVNGDISTFLRYKYYARTFTYRLGIFDQIGFPDVGSRSNVEFERVRGGLLLFEFPRNYNNRWFWLVQDDRLTFGDLTRVDNRKNNVYTKIGYQFGTQFDERMNAIVGESRGRITPVLTAFRDLGPQKFGFAAAVTQSAHVATGDYKYTKFQAEALKRFDVTATTFVVSRLHTGFFAGRDQVRGQEADAIDRYSIPRYEMFRLGGREALKGVTSGASASGTHELHTTAEYFAPVFRNRDYRTWLLHWNTLYGIGYVGAGAVGFELGDVAKSERAVVDAGIGAEASLTVRDFEVLFSVIYARTVKAPEEIDGGKVRFSIRTIR
ncbi:MAG TPA: hypothetical protein VNL91_11075 [Thermoanaerobaculia bacterium]|nr:hypothetical protein [Thermoanaerobaculia bacterium]